MKKYIKGNKRRTSVIARRIVKKVKSFSYYNFRIRKWQNRRDN